MWAAGGPAVDRDGFVYMSTGSSVLNTLAGMGPAGVFPDSEGNWGHPSSSSSTPRRKDSS